MLEAGAGMAPIFPQQSIREMTRTSRTPTQVMGDALRGAEAGGWTGVVGADADHLKNPADVDATAAVGFTFFTIDPSGHVDQRADDYSENVIREKFADTATEVSWIDGYRGRRVTLSTGTALELTDAACVRAAVKYGRAINQAVSYPVELPNVGIGSFEDLESGDSVIVDTASPSVRAHYAKQMRGLRAEQVQLFTKLGLDYCVVRTDQPYIKPLRDLFARRARRAHR